MDELKKMDKLYGMEFYSPWGRKELDMTKATQYTCTHEIIT